ncbi:MAG TPA: Bcr/CflA family efflux MFS transporter [Gammaproteobacteria bacterium]|nr:Bcr/CflA family efflux MFS transporter [Gammaproteobacteria bacterium]
MLRVIIPLCLIATMAQFATDIYLPSLISLSQDLSSSVHMAQGTIAIYLIFAAFSQLIFGSLSDVRGRYPLLVFSILLAMLGSVVCSLSTSIEYVFLGRAIQGLGGGGTAVLSRIIVIDTFKDEALIKVTSYLSFCSIVILAIAPIFGGFVEELLGWRANFIVLSLYMLMILGVVIIFITETLPIEKRKVISIQRWWKIFYELIHTLDFLCFSLCYVGSYSCIIVWLTVSPILLQGSLHLTPIQFGYCYAVGCGAFAIGALSNPRWVVLMGARKTLFLGIALEVVAGVIFTLQGVFEVFSVYSILFVNAVMMYGCMLVLNNSFAAAFHSVQSVSGMAASIFGFGRIALSAGVSAIIAYLPEETPFSLGVSVVLLSVFSYQVASKGYQKN